MSNPMTPLAICVSDIHLSHSPPPARSVEPDWFEAMKRPLKQLQKIKDEFQVPLLYAGDIFDIWKVYPELINFALVNLPSGYAIPGNHELPYHSYAEIRKSAFYTLARSGVLSIVPPGKPVSVGNLRIHGFPTGYPLTNNEAPANAMTFEIALVHDFVWKKGKGEYPGVKEKQKARSILGKIRGYDFLVFGDNHTRFMTENEETVLVNCGGFIRRKIDEQKLKPSVSVLFEDKGRPFASFLDLDCRKDKFLDNKATVDLLKSMGDVDFDSVIEKLNGLSDTKINFVKAINEAIKDLPVSIRNMVRWLIDLQ